MSHTQDNISRSDIHYLQRLSVTVGLVLLALTSAPFVTLPTRPLTFEVFGSPLSLHVSERYVFVALLVGLVCTGTDALLRTHPSAQRRPLENTFVMWTVPALTILLAALALPFAPSLLLWIGGILLTGLLIGMIMTAEYHTIDPRDSRFASSQFILQTMTYVLALTSFSVIYGAKSRSLLSATSLFVITALLTLERLRPTGHTLSTTSFYGLTTGLVIAQSVWALNYSRVPGIAGGSLLLIVFHVVSGLATQQLSGRLTSHALIEYGIVAAIGTGLTIHYLG